jgi:hypothetical protein
MSSGEDADLATIEARLEQLRPEMTRRYWQCVSWAIAGFGIMVLTLVVAYTVTKSDEPATAILLVVGCLVAVLALSRSWLLLYLLMPLKKERARLRLESQRRSSLA